MADLSITAAQVLPGADAILEHGTAGAAVTPGQPVYKDASDHKWKLADADSTSAIASARGVAVSQSAADGQSISVQTGGTLTLGAGAGPAVGTIYVLSGTAGGIAPAADLASGDRTTILGVGGATNTLKLSVYASDQQVP